MDVSELKAKIRDIKDFPTEGILFKDITTLLKDPRAFKYVVDQMANHYIQSRVEIVVGIESKVRTRRRWSSNRPSSVFPARS